MLDDHEELTGGLVSEGVVRIGATVRRPVSAQTPTIHRLLRHVRDQGVTWAPAVHGIDDEGREILDFLEGDVGHGRPEWLFSEDNLVAAGRALRQWHDATATFARSADDVWWAEPIEPAEVICAIDFAPYNHVFRDGRWAGAFDLDLCLPGPRLWDVAHTAYRYVPLTPGPDDSVAHHPSAEDSPFDHAQQRRRLELFLAAYAGDDAPVTVEQVLPWVVRRLDAMADWGETQPEPHPEHARMYRSHARWLASGGLDPS